MLDGQARKIPNSAISTHLFGSNNPIEAKVSAVWDDLTLYPVPESAILTGLDCLMNYENKIYLVINGIKRHIVKEDTLTYM